MLDDLIDIYVERMYRDNKNIERVHQFYSNEESFTSLINRIIEKDLRRFNKLLCGCSSCDGNEEREEIHAPHILNVLYIILDIVQHEGEEVEPFDLLTKTYPSRTIMYYGWTFSWVHGEITLISIYNRNNELVYRF